MAEISVSDSIPGKRISSLRPLTRSRTVGYVAEPFDSEKLPLALASNIRHFLRVANQIESESPRVAYLCRVHAFERAHQIDPSCKYRGVRQFKTNLLLRLEQDAEATVLNRKEKSDVRELKCFYHKYADYILKHGGVYETASSELLMKAHGIVFVLVEVLKTVTSDASLEIVTSGETIEEKSELCVYNILPLGPGGAQQAIMQLPEIKAAVAAVRNIRGLPLAENHQRSGSFMDLLDWLQGLFGFQKGNIANQREHLILLLANIHIRQIPKPASMSELDERAVNGLMKKLFKNYKNWCKFLGRKSNIWLPSVNTKVQQHKILYICLYLLIWGEASNLRFMPECLCYIFHHMAYELYGVLSGSVSLTGEKVTPVYGGGSESFLTNVVTPIYKVIYEEAQKNKSGTADHSKWRNYDDLNEYFWSPDCFQLGWPMRHDHDFFTVLSSKDHHFTNAQETTGEDHERKWLGKTNFVQIRSFLHLFQSFFFTILSSKDHHFTNAQDTTGEDHERKWLGKTNFVETRSFLHLFRSFDRMWSFFVLSLQAMIIMAWHGLGSPFQLFDSDPIIFEDIMSIFITSAVLSLIQAVLDIAFTWKARHIMNFFQILRYALKLVSATTWTIILPIYYADSRRNSTCSAQRFGSGIGQWCFSSYTGMVALYLMTNVIGMVLFFVPAVSSYIEISNQRLCTILSWWAQPRLYVGRGMQEGQVPLLKYTLFWVPLLLSKLSFSYYFEIKPLVEPTKQIMKISVSKYDWHELFPKVKSNAGAIVAVWAPIILVYFMDTQIWYSVFCTIFGGVSGIFHHLGEIRTMGMLRSRFQSLPAAFNGCLIPPSPRKEHKKNIGGFFQQKVHKVSENEKSSAAKFAQIWNQIISSFRSEDLISNREMDLMTIPLSSELTCGLVRWPVFLLATKFSTALDIARDFVGKDEYLYRKIRKDYYMHCAVKECYDSLKNILDFLVVGDTEKRIVAEIIFEVETSINRSSFLVDFKLSGLLPLHTKCIQLVDLLLENEKCHQDKVVKLLQDIFEVITKDMMIDGSRILGLTSCSQPLEDTACLFRRREPQLFASSDPPAILFPLPNNGPLKEQVRRLYLLLTVKESALNIPINLEARRRISFFATSLFMDIPAAPKVRNMLSFSVLTPYYMEEVNFSEEELHSRQDGASIFFYMQKIYPDEWTNFLERMECDNLEDFNDVNKLKELRNWASFRGQTLSRTVRGMMYYRKALKLQAFLDMAEDEDILEGFKGFEGEDDGKISQYSLSAQLDALADMKFTYIISFQTYGALKSSGDSHAQDILDLMGKYTSLRVAYIEEKEEIGAYKPQKTYSSILVKAINDLEQEIYRIKLPGPPNIGEGKPENQNHSIIFTRGDAVQAIDMNQDNYMEEAFKMRNILQEFLRHRGEKPPTILGLREHIFTGSVSSLAGFMSYQETSFVTIGQRLLANPLRVRFHYGHPDLFDRVFHLTRGGISKASKTINLSEDVFAGFNSTLRQGYVTYHEYMQVGKGRDVGLNQISKFEAKVANGNSEQTLSRDIFRLGRRFDFFRMLSCYFTTVGFYSNSLISILGVYVFLYGQLYLILSGVGKALLIEAGTQNIKSLETALASQSFLQLGLLTGLPMVIEIGLEKGFRTALSDFILMQFQLAAVFFTFSLGTKSHYYGRTVLHGGAKYRPTGRKFVVCHASFTENYRLYSRSHFVKGFELMFLLIVYNLFCQSYQNNMKYVLATYSIWFMLGTWLFAPFLFNPSGFEWQKTVEDWKDWNRWINNLGGIGVQQDKSWESWWNDEQAHLKHSGLSSRIFEILLSLRFFLYQYGLVYHLDISHGSKNFLVYVLSWVVIGIIFLLIKVVKKGRQRLSIDFQFWFRIFKASLFLGVLSIIIFLSGICKLSVMDLFICCLAFIPTGWGLLSIAQAVRPKIENWQIWDSIQILAQAYDYGMGLLLFSSIAALAWLPVSAFHNHILFKEAFSRRLQIQPILAGKNKAK
ncbi:glucan synthase-like 4 [Tasmannia lanceolata]|uniref:glucan synthase-like 4 n=1 Tax=Tasmannia lanceolata TaxID=3420 RepID=UPI004063AEB6